MREELVLKHAVGGRTFFQTKNQKEYEVIPEGEHWRINIQLNPEVKIDEILTWKEELNLFIFQEFDDQPTKKIWFYLKNGNLRFDEQNQILTIKAESKIEYVPSNYSV
jgi:hypothetical protein